MASMDAQISFEAAFSALTEHLQLSISKPELIDFPDDLIQPIRRASRPSDSSLLRPLLKLFESSKQHNAFKLLPTAFVGLVSIVTHFPHSVTQDKLLHIFMNTLRQYKDQTVSTKALAKCGLDDFAQTQLNPRFDLISKRLFHTLLKHLVGQGIQRELRWTVAQFISVLIHHHAPSRDRMSTYSECKHLHSLLIDPDDYVTRCLTADIIRQLIGYGVAPETFFPDGTPLQTVLSFPQNTSSDRTWLNALQDFFSDMDPNTAFAGARQTVSRVLDINYNDGIRPDLPSEGVAVIDEHIVIVSAKDSDCLQISTIPVLIEHEMAVSNVDGSPSALAIFYSHNSGYQLHNGIRSAVDTISVLFGSEDDAAIAIESTLEAQRSAKTAVVQDASDEAIDVSSRQRSIAFLNLWTDTQDDGPPRQTVDTQKVDDYPHPSSPLQQLSQKHAKQSPSKSALDGDEGTESEFSFLEAQQDRSSFAMKLQASRDLPKHAKKASEFTKAADKAVKRSRSRSRLRPQVEIHEDVTTGGQTHLPAKALDKSASLTLQHSPPSRKARKSKLKPATALKPTDNTKHTPSQASSPKYPLLATKPTNHKTVVPKGQPSKKKAGDSMARLAVTQHRPPDTGRDTESQTSKGLKRRAPPATKSRPAKNADWKEGFLDDQSFDLPDDTSHDELPAKKAKIKGGKPSAKKAAVSKLKGRLANLAKSAKKPAQKTHRTAAPAPTPQLPSSTIALTRQRRTAGKITTYEESSGSSIHELSEKEDDIADTKTKKTVPKPDKRLPTRSTKSSAPRVSPPASDATEQNQSQIISPTAEHDIVPEAIAHGEVPRSPPVDLSNERRATVQEHNDMTNGDEEIAEDPYFARKKDNMHAEAVQGQKEAAEDYAGVRMEVPSELEIIDLHDATLGERQTPTETGLKIKGKAVQTNEEAMEASHPALFVRHEIPDGSAKVDRDTVHAPKEADKRNVGGEDVDEEVAQDSYLAAAEQGCATSKVPWASFSTQFEGMLQPIGANRENAPPGLATPFGSKKSFVASVNAARSGSPSKTPLRTRKLQKPKMATNMDEPKSKTTRQTIKPADKGKSERRIRQAENTPTPAKQETPKNKKRFSGTDVMKSGGIKNQALEEENAAEEDEQSPSMTRPKLFQKKSHSFTSNKNSVTEASMEAQSPSRQASQERKKRQKDLEEQEALFIHEEDLNGHIVRQSRHAARSTKVGRESTAYFKTATESAGGTESARVSKTDNSAVAGHRSHKLDPDTTASRSNSCAQSNADYPAGSVAEDVAVPVEQPKQQIRTPRPSRIHKTDSKSLLISEKSAKKPSIVHFGRDGPQNQRKLYSARASRASAELDNESGEQDATTKAESARQQNSEDATTLNDTKPSPEGAPSQGDESIHHNDDYAVAGNYEKGGQDYVDDQMQEALQDAAPPVEPTLAKPTQPRQDTEMSSSGSEAPKEESVISIDSSSSAQDEGKESEYENSVEEEEEVEALLGPKPGPKIPQPPTSRVETPDLEDEDSTQRPSRAKTRQLMQAAKNSMGLRELMDETFPNASISIMTDQFRKPKPSPRLLKGEAGENPVRTASVGGFKELSGSQKQMPPPQRVPSTSQLPSESRSRLSWPENSKPASLSPLHQRRATISREPSTHVATARVKPSEVLSLAGMEQTFIPSSTPVPFHVRLEQGLNNLGELVRPSAKEAPQRSSYLTADAADPTLVENRDSGAFYHQRQRDMSESTNDSSSSEICMPRAEKDAAGMGDAGGDALSSIQKGLRDAFWQMAEESLIRLEKEQLTIETQVENFEAASTGAVGQMTDIWKTKIGHAGRKMREQTDHIKQDLTEASIKLIETGDWQSTFQTQKITLMVDYRGEDLLRSMQDARKKLGML